MTRLTIVWISHSIHFGSLVEEISALGPRANEVVHCVVTGLTGDLLAEVRFLTNYSL